MIYARIDVDLRDHQKADAAGSAMALWLWSVLWCRAQKSTGWIPRRSLLGSHWFSKKELDRYSKRLVLVGLWLEETVADERGYRIYNYAQKQDTKEVIDARIEAARLRKARWKEKRERDLERVPPKAVERVPSGFGYGSLLSESGSDLDPDGVPGEERGSEVRVRAAPETREFTDPPGDLEITPEVLAACAMAGVPAPTKTDVWHYLSNARKKAQQSADWPAGLVAWMCRQKGFDARSRKDLVQPVPEGGRLWKVGDGS